MARIWRVSIEKGGGGSFRYFDRCPSTGELVDFILNKTNRHAATDDQMRRLATKLIESRFSDSFGLRAEHDGPTLHVSMFPVASCEGLNEFSLVQSNIAI